MTNGFRLIVAGTLIFALNTDAQTTNRKAEKEGDGDVLMKCFYQPASDEQSSSLPTTPIGFKFSLLRNNENQIAVDAYNLNESNQPIKQISHAELETGIGEIQATTKASNLLSNLQLSENSPFNFSMSFGSTASSDSPGSRFEAKIEVLETFTGATWTSLSVHCRVAPEKNTSPSNAPSGGSQ